MAFALKKTLDNFDKREYNILKDGGEGLDLSSIPLKTSLTTLYIHFRPNSRREIEDSIRKQQSNQLWKYYSLVKEGYEKNKDLFVSPPVFSGGFFRDIVYGFYVNDLDLFVNSYGVDEEEMTDNIYLFLSSLELGGFQEKLAKNGAYNFEGKFRVFDCFLVGLNVPLQVIVKDMGPPQEDPLYVTEDFHYNHGRAALSVEGPPVVHYHGHAVAGWEAPIHAQYREGGMQKIQQKAFVPSFKKLIIENLTNPLERKKQKIKERNAFVSRFVPNLRRTVP